MAAALDVLDVASSESPRGGDRCLLAAKGKSAVLFLRGLIIILYILRVWESGCEPTFWMVLPHILLNDQVTLAAGQSEGVV